VSFLDPPPLAFAHRGGAAAGDENTSEAFGRSIALGYRYLETDGHATADGVPVVLHDPDLARVSGTAGLVAGLRWADLAAVRVAGAGAVPRLDDVLAAWPQTRFNIDVKADTAVGPAVAAVRRAGAEDRVLLASFDDARLVRLRALAGPRVVTSLGQRAVARLRAASLAGLRFRPAPTVVAAQVPVRYGRLTVVDRRLVACAHRAGLQVHVWTIDEPGEMRRLLDLGVDGIMTDRIETLRDVFAERGLWPPPH
jgi:glycerophosphoryl diester phosphodiesterase